MTTATAARPLSLDDVTGDVVTAEEAARIGRVGYRPMLAALADGELDAVRLAGWAYRIPKASLQRWLAGLPPASATRQAAQPEIVELPPR